jgi:hypothetical protein
MTPLKNPFVKLSGYVVLKRGNNGSFCVFDPSDAVGKWRAGRHQWLVKLMPDGPAQTTRTQSEAITIAEVSAKTTNAWKMWWEASSSPTDAVSAMIESLRSNAAG